ncbi:Ig-like domain-containing protein [Lysinibacillus fusiformis]|uniref:Ig-like domain-containing protein n=1 Tax=Lysinibacillus fusiformis TaxID=28031 RepID=UPI0036DFE4F2
MLRFIKNGFLYLALTLLTLVSFNIESASATEAVDYEEGVTNLNNTPENSAVVGDRLTQPEIGWKRYDDTHNKIFYEKDKWSRHTVASAAYDYKKGSTGAKKNVIAKMEFWFLGSKINIITYRHPSYSKDALVKIDGIDQGNLQIVGSDQSQTLAFKKDGLDFGFHKVEVMVASTSPNVETFNLRIDAIDVDGKLVAPDEVTNNESITLDKNALELLEGNQDKLTATVTPDTAKVIWSSNDESVATVDQDGNVTAIKEGEAIITAKIEGTDISATSTVIVKKPDNSFSNAILSITLVNGITKEYDVTNTVLNNYLNWFESAQGTSTFKFSKTISPYKKVTEYIVHDKIASFEVREY